MKYGIQNGIFDKIYIGRLNKANTEFLDDKEDATNLAINAVIEHTLNKYGGSLTFKVSNKKYSVEVKEIEK